jgi:hypothetical protein
MLDLSILGTVSLILNLFNIRICPFYHIFKVPCPGCGLTRGFIELFKLNIRESIKYNILCIPICIIFIIYLSLIVIKKDYLITDIFNKYKIFIIIILAIILLVVFFINYNNTLLY